MRELYCLAGRAWKNACCSGQKQVWNPQFDRWWLPHSLLHSFRVLRAFYAFIGPSVFQLTYWETDEPKSKRVSRTNGPATDDANVIIASFPGRLPLRFLDRIRLKAQTMQQQIHEYCSLSSNITMNIWLIPVTSSCEYCKWWYQLAVNKWMLLH